MARKKKTLRERHLKGTECVLFNNRLNRVQRSGKSLILLCFVLLSLPLVVFGQSDALQCVCVCVCMLWANYCFCILVTKAIHLHSSFVRQTTSYIDMGKWLQDITVKYLSLILKLSIFNSCWCCWTPAAAWRMTQAVILCSFAAAQRTIQVIFSLVVNCDSFSEPTQSTLITVIGFCVNNANTTQLSMMWQLLSHSHGLWSKQILVNTFTSRTNM